MNRTIRAKYNVNFIGIYFSINPIKHRFDLYFVSSYHVHLCHNFPTNLKMTSTVK